MLRTNFGTRRTFVRLRASITRLKPCYCSVCPFCIFFSYPLKKAVKFYIAKNKINATASLASLNSPQANITFADAKISHCKAIFHTTKLYITEKSTPQGAFFFIPSYRVFGWNQRFPFRELCRMTKLCPFRGLRIRHKAPQLPAFWTGWGKYIRP